MTPKTLFFILLAWLPASSFACSCVPHEKLESKIPKWVSSEAGAFVAVATAEAIEHQNDQSDTQITTFRVVEQFGNYQGSVFKTKIENACCMCGIEFNQGETYLIYTYPTDGGYYTTSICSRTKKIERAGEEIKLLRQYKVNNSSQRTR